MIVKLPPYANARQIVQNMGCRVIKNLKKFDHITEAMKDLHWQKIPEHIQFKVLVTIYQCVNGLAPSFLIDKKPQRHEKEFKIRYPRKTSNTRKSLTTMQQVNQICWTKTME